MSGIAATIGLGLRQKHQADKAAKSSDRRQRQALKKAEAAQAYAEAAKPGASRTLDLSTSLDAAKKLRGVQSTYLASRGGTSQTLGVA